MTLTGLQFAHAEQPQYRQKISLVDPARTTACSLTLDRFAVRTRAGEAVVVMGVGNVFTDARYRKLGLASRVMDHAIAHMRSTDTQVSLLYGIDNFYHRWGYESCGDEHTLRLLLTPATLPDDTLPSGYTTRAATPDDLPLLESLYDASTANVAGANVGASRARAWNWLRVALADGAPARRDGWPDGPVTGAPECTIVLGGDGRAVGYCYVGTGSYSVDELARRNADDAVVGELHASSAEAAEAVIRIARMQARDWASTQGRAFTAVTTGSRPGHMIADVAAAGHHCELRREPRPHGGLMALVLDETVEAPSDWYQFLPDRF